MPYFPPRPIFPSHLSLSSTRPQPFPPLSLQSPRSSPPLSTPAATVDVAAAEEIPAACSRCGRHRPTTSAPLPPAAGRLTTSAPLLPVAGPTTSAPLPLTSGRLTASASPSHMVSGSTPPPSEPVHADDETSHHEGEAYYNETMRAMWINEGNKIEPTQSSQFITKTIQAHFPGPIHRFSDFPMDVQDLLFSMLLRNHRFTEHSDELRARSAWTTTARANFKHLMYNVRKNVERACASTDKNQWKEHGPVWMRNEYWTKLCDIWGSGKWNENSSKAKQNRAAHPEANVHTSGSISFATHKARLGRLVSDAPNCQIVDKRPLFANTR
ncbi:hypothetical protein Taro_021530 [Colocasia esculenta]|uniref:Transposase n=1 Tax=Colocasia esculenta TaxID=4460 RepID=A0A843UZA9_COLES|nr:hypothetical protein [Colocasia esculenta]